jgi:SAM-dependent methyltransferase
MRPTPRWLKFFPEPTRPTLWRIRDKVIGALAASILPESILATIPHYHRSLLARRYLHGSGLEIGAMHFPVPVPRKLKVKYVDRATPEESHAKFRDLPYQEMVRPDYLEDGFTLPSIPPQSQDFVMAHHVLEHSPDALGVLETWAKVLKPGGALFISVPIGAMCFDRNRPVTPLEHFIEDARVIKEEGPEALRTRNLSHYLEWVQQSPQRRLSTEQNGADQELSAAEVRKRADELCRRSVEIHFHVFSEESFRDLLAYFATHNNPRFTVKTVTSQGIEILGVLARA